MIVEDKDGIPGHAVDVIVRQLPKARGRLVDLYGHLASAVVLRSATIIALYTLAVQYPDIFVSLSSRA